MNYYYILFVLSFIIFGIYNAILSRIKENDPLIILFRAITIIGYIVLAINLYNTFYWVYSLLLFVFGWFLFPSIIIKILNLIIPSNILKYMVNPYVKTIWAYLVLSILMIVLLTINLF